MNSTLVWLRRDLRLNDHAALHEALQAEHAVQPVFVFDKTILERFDNPDDRRLTFLAETLCHLHEQLQERGGGMLVFYGKAETDIPKLADALSAAQVISEEDYEPATRKRDEAIKKQLQGQARFVQVVDHVIHAPGKVLKDDGDPYKVFTPFSKRWRQVVNGQSYAEKEVNLSGRLRDYPSACKLADEAGLKRLDVSAGPQAMLEAMGYRHVELGQWGVRDARERLHRYIDRHVKDYKDRRNFLADEDGTSRLSPYLRHGLISVREACRLVSEHENKGAQGWLNELIWREFYHHILYYFPDSVSQEFQEQYRGMGWDDDADQLKRWKDGTTGYPIVDAAMRQLKEEGWMHNRARMIVASFFTKDLHLNWRVGEEHFAQYLMDYELSSNVGGWQWAASTGTDAQPYFRIFNPELQSKKFDPNGAYIRRFVPELREARGDAIHAPHKEKDLFSDDDYPEPIVEHHAEKDKAIAMFKQASG